MSAKFPLVGMRRKINGVWELQEKNEEIVVPQISPFIIRLSEVPDNGDIKTAPLISGLSRTTGYPPSVGQFYVNYKTGDIEFHAGESGKNLIVNYWGKGSLVEVDDINYLHDNINIPIIQYVQLTQQNIDDKYIILDYETEFERMYSIINWSGTTQTIGVDYDVDTLNMRRIYWGGLYLDGIISVNNIISINLF